MISPLLSNLFKPAHPLTIKLFCGISTLTDLNLLQACALVVNLLLAGALLLDIFLKNGMSVLVIYKRQLDNIVQYIKGDNKMIFGSVRQFWFVKAHKKLLSIVLVVFPTEVL